MAKDRSDKGVDWGKPLIYWDELLGLFGYTESSMQKWCQQHRDICQPINGGKYHAHRDRLVEWFGSGRDAT